jgi:hypothetical protein
MYQQAGGLVNGDQVFVTVKDGKRFLHSGNSPST